LGKGERNHVDPGQVPVSEDGEDMLRPQEGGRKRIRIGIPETREELRRFRRISKADEKEIRRGIAIGRKKIE